MKSGPEKVCRNCSSPMPEDALYCPSCGQKYTTGKVPVNLFFQDFLSQYYNLDSRFFRTLIGLLVPGKLTVQYFKGKHKSYANPLQLFLVPAFFLFALVSWKISNSDLGDHASIALKEDIDWSHFYQQLDSAKQQTDSLFTEPIAHAATDSLSTILRNKNPEPKDSIVLGNLGNTSPDLPILTVSKEDWLSKSPDELVDLYGKDRTLIEQIVMRQGAKFKQGGRGIIEYFISRLSITLLVMMPFLALILKLLYIRHNYYFVEHLVFNFHFHAFVFILLLILGLLSKYLSGLIIGLAILSIFVYFYLGMKNVYGQSWLKTLFKFILLLGSYFFIAIFFSIIAAVFSFLLF